MTEKFRLGEMRARAGTGDSRQTLNRCYEIATTSPDFGLKTIVSGIAAVLTAAAFVPQAYKIIQGRETEGVSLWMHIILRGELDVLVCAWGDALELADHARERGDFHTNVHHHHNEAAVRLMWACGPSA